MSKKFKLNRVSGIALATALTMIGGGAFSFVTFAAENTAVVQEASELSLPGAGMGSVIDKYVGTLSGSSVEMLSTTALASSLGDSYNEYYDENGEIIGKFIVYKGKKDAKIYDSIPGNNRVEKGESKAKVVGYLSKGDVATLVMTQGKWYQIISDTVNGFVKKSGFATGIAAEKLDKKTYVKAVYAKNDEVILYSDPWDTSDILCVLPQKVRFEMTEAGDEFSQIAVEGVGLGWVHNSLTKVRKERRFAISAAKKKADQEKIAKGLEAAAAIREKIEEEIEDFEEANNNSQEEGGNNGNSGGGGYTKPTVPDDADTAALREAIAAYAQQFVGVLPYIWASSDLSYGADCSGFTSAIYREFGIEISRSSDAQAWEGTSVSIDDIRPGDIVCYPGHVALYIGNGTVVHESVPGTTASYADMNMMPIINIARYIN